MTRSFVLFGLLSGISIDASADDSSGHATFVGVASCASSNCHGSVTAHGTTNILQNEYVTWYKHDRHSLAYKALQSDDSKRIAEHLGIEAAEREPLCLSCHSTFRSENDSRGPKFRLEDGVGCESCHGAADGWLTSHTAKGATHRDNVTHGMVDLVSLEKRGEFCTSCHFGNDQKEVNHRLIGAGHPRLSFELDTFSMVQPPHWKEDDDYRQRKADYDASRAWLVGQAVVAKEMLNALASPKRARFGMMPELTRFECFSCHHSLAEKQWQKRTYGGHPGELRVNLSSLVILREALAVLSPKLGDTLAATVRTAHDEYSRKDLTKSFKGTVEYLDDKVIPFLNESHISTDRSLMMKLLRHLAEFGAATPDLQYETAEQIAMGISSLQSALDPSGSLYKREVQGLYDTLKSPSEFNVTKFAAAAKTLLAKAR